MVEVAYHYLPKIEVSTPIIDQQVLYDLATKYGTPYFIIDEATLHSKLRELKDGFKDFSNTVRIAFSMKANFNPSVIKAFISENALFDVTSIGELFFYLNCGGATENVIYTSVTETKEEFCEVLEKGVRLIVIGSFNGLLNLIDAASEKRIIPSVMIRVNPEVGVKAEVRASYRYGKFGVPLNGHTTDSASNLLRKIINSKNLIFEGFHFHLGSQIENPICFVNALEKLETFILKMRKEIPDLHIKIIDIGGGTPVSYGSPVPSPSEIGSIITKKLNSMAQNLGDRFTLIVESGRFLSAEASVLVSKIINLKVYEGHKFIFVDAGYHLLLDAALLRQEYPQEVVPCVEDTENLKINLAGRLCDTYDIFPLSPASKLSGAELGKLIVFRNVGAYSIVFNMPFHCQTKPPILFRKTNGEFVLARKGETIEELFEEEGGNINTEV
ncbi:MAG: diaminopimelate decarboxylase family protein [Nitrososphaerales archaeon]